jgi:hypothetical protein
LTSGQRGLYSSQIQKNLFQQPQDAADREVENIRLHNVNGTTGRTCKCGSWLEHWKNFSRHELPPCCPEEACPGKPEVGAHVQKSSPPDKNCYIIPLCRTCNGSTGESITAGDREILEPASVSRTCSK